MSSLLRRDALAASSAPARCKTSHLSPTTRSAISGQDCTILRKKPNDWEREIKQKATGDGAAYYDIKERFWQDFITRHPTLAEAGFRVWRYPNNYIQLHDAPQIDLSVWIGRNESGIYLRSGWGEPSEPLADLLGPHRERLETALGTAFGPSGRGKHFLAKNFPNGHEAADWTPIMDWMQEQIESYRDAVAHVLKASRT